MLTHDFRRRLHTLRAGWRPSARTERAEHRDDAACFAPVAREPTGLYPSSPREERPLKLNVLPAVDDLAADKFHDECGVFGIFGHAEASNLTYLGIHALQHRGQESAGIASL